jgi:hypothetical protein
MGTTSTASVFRAAALAAALVAFAGAGGDAAEPGGRSAAPGVSEPTRADAPGPRKIGRGKARTTFQAIPVSPSVMQPLPEIPPPRFPAPLPPPRREPPPALVTPGAPPYGPGILAPGPGGSLICTPIGRQQGLC